MVTTFGLDLFKDPFFIGFNRELNRLNHVHSTNTGGFPPYDLLKLNDDNYVLTLAVAGFSKESLDITVDQGTLIIKGNQIEIVDAEVLHKWIATRKFTRSFALGEYMEVTNAELADGMLSIKITRLIPEEKKPKAITIN